MGNSCQNCNKNMLAKILTSVLLLMSYLYNMYSASEKPLVHKIINSVHHTVITIINFTILFVFHLSNSKGEQKENVGERGKKEKHDALNEGKNLVALFSKNTSF